MARSSGQHVSPHAKRVARVLRLNRLLHDHLGRAKVCDLCDELGISRRTLQRDLSILRTAGEDIDYVQCEKCYRIAVRNAVGAAAPTARELGAFIAVMRGAVAEAGSDFESSLQAFGAKVQDMLAPELQAIMPEAEEWSRRFEEAACK